MTAPKGELELENWATTKSRAGAIREFEFRHDFELGLTDRTQIGFGLATWTHSARARESRYQDTSLELTHNLLNPATAFLGSAISAEVSVGEKHTAFEGKLILEKRLGKWLIGWSGALESAYEGQRFADLQDSEAEISQSLGVAYNVNKTVSFGGELVHKMPLGKWHGPANGEVYAGPSLSIHRKQFAASLAALLQTTDRSEKPAMQSRIVVGFEF